MLTQEVVIMGRPRRAFTQEFKREAVKLATESGHPTAQVARNLGLTPNLLRRLEAGGHPRSGCRLPRQGTTQAP
jgi:transposase